MQSHVVFLPDDGYDSSREFERAKTKPRKEKSKMRATSLEDLKATAKPSLRADKSSVRYRNDLGNYRAVKMGLFRNGDPWFGPVNFHFLPGKEITSLDILFKVLSPKMDLING